MRTRLRREEPLAAWIASPESERPSRWRRIANAIPNGWVDLVSVSDLDTISLVQAMTQTDTAWREQAVRQVINSVDSDSSLLVDIVSLLDVDAYKAMAAHVLLLLGRTHRRELDTILPWLQPLGWMLLSTKSKY